MHFGLALGGFGLSEMKHTKYVILASCIARDEALKADVAAGKIDVWDTSEQEYRVSFKQDRTTQNPSRLPGRMADRLNPEVL